MDVTPTAFIIICAQFGSVTYKNNPFNQSKELKFMLFCFFVLSLILNFVFNLPCNGFSPLRAMHYNGNCLCHCRLCICSTALRYRCITYFQSWVTEMREDDHKPQVLRTDMLLEGQNNLPPVRCSSSCLPANQVSPVF